ncbi:MAG: ABC transporter permease [Solirubrobacteraceae bacterium MAG38_C4-C5]|nr:ABC transporter permease [Candidatus Siliceabacter maunaloa]
MRAALADAVRRLRAAPGRAALAAAGIVAAAAMLGAGVTVSYGLTTGFERSAQQADLPDVLARFGDEEREEVEERVAALPNLEQRTYRYEETSVPLSANGESSEDGVIHAVRGERRGYAILEGRDVTADDLDGAVVERGVAQEWDLEVGDTISSGSQISWEIVGIGVSPDNVAYPLASSLRIYVSGPALEEAFDFVLPVNMALLWSTEPERTDVLLQQARANSYGLSDLRFITREGVEVAVGEAAGIVIALLVAFSIVALAAAGAMLATAAHADVQRRLGTIGIQRAVGMDRRAVAVGFAASGAVLAAPAGVLGLALGTLVAAGPTGALLLTLNELPPGGALVGPLLLAWLVVVAVVALASGWPAWRAAGRPIVGLLRGSEVARPRAARGLSRGPFGLGLRLALGRPARLGGTALVLAACTAVVTLMLALASLLVDLSDDPASLGKRYELTAQLDADSAPDVRALPGVEAATPRYELDATASFQLGQPVRLIGFEGDHVPFEAPPLADGRRLDPDADGLPEAEVGAGLAEALGLAPGSTLAVQLPDGVEERFRVVGVVRALDNDGRVAYVPADTVSQAADESAIAVKLTDGASQAAVQAGLIDLGAADAGEAEAATTDDAAFLATLAALLRAVALVNGLVCLYALMQALALTARERRGTIAVLRATGAGRGHVALLLGGVVAAATIPAVVAGLALQRWALGPATADLAAGYADLQLTAAGAQAAGVAVGVALLAAFASWWVARRTTREPVVVGLREE